MGNIVKEKERKEKRNDGNLGEALREDKREGNGEHSERERKKGKEE